MLDERGDHGFARSVAVVDDHEWRRRGLVDGLRELGGVFALAGSFTTHQALTRGGWADVDVVLVDLSGRGDRWDRFAAFDVVASIGANGGQCHPTLILLHEPGAGPLIPVRAAEAGADFIYPYSALGTIEELERLALVPDVTRTPSAIADTSLLHTLGVSFSSRLNAGLALIQQEGMTALFDPGDVENLSRRRSITIRHQLATVMRVSPVPTTGGPVEAEFPSWRQLKVVVQMARGLRTPT